MALMVNGKVEIAFGSNRTTDPAAYGWTDVSDYVEGHQQVTMTRGRQDEFSESQPATITLTLDNKDGRFTPGNTGSPYYPNVKRSTPIRLTVTEGGVTYRRFTGFIKEWPVVWPQSSDGYASVTVTAVTEQARLTARSSLRAMSVEEALLLSPAAFFPLNEPSGSPAGVDVSAGARPNLVASAPTLFGQEGITPTDSYSSARDIRAKSTGAGRAVVSTAATGYTLTAVIRENYDIPTIGRAPILGVTSTAANGTQGAAVHVANGGLLGFTYRNNAGTFSYTTTADVEPATSAATVATKHVALVVTRSAGSASFKVYVDGAPLGDTFTSRAVETAPLEDIYSAQVLAAFSDQYDWKGTHAHAGVWDRPLTQTEVYTLSRAALTGFRGESPASRFSRLARYVGLMPSVPTAPSTAVMGLQPTEDRQPLDLLRQVADTENGLLYEDVDNVLTLRDDSYRDLASGVAISLSAVGQEIGGNLTAKLDDFGLINDVTVESTDPLVAPVRAVDPDAVALDGRFEQTITTAGDQATVNALAAFYLTTYADPRVRIPELDVELTSLADDKRAAMLALELGDRVQLTQLPAQAPASTLTFLVEGVRESLTATGGWVMTLNLSPDIYA